MKKFLLKILAITSVIVLLLNIGDNLLNASVLEKIDNNNQVSFKNINSSKLGKVGVAMSTKIGLNTEKDTVISSVFTGGISVGKNDEILSSHMIFIKDYFNFLKTDVKSIIDSSYDKSDMLQAYIDQIEVRYKLALSNEKELISKRDNFISQVQEYSTQLETLKQKISYDFQKTDSEKSLENIDTYIELNKKISNAKIYGTYMNNFIQQYDVLNGYAKNIASVLITNKDAIIKDSYVVIPKDLGIDALKKFNLLYEEGDTKP